MKGYKVTVTIYIQAEDADCAIYAVEDEMDALTSSCDTGVYATEISNAVTPDENFQDEEDEE